MWDYDDIKDKVTGDTSNTVEGVLENIWFVPVVKILLFICDWYFNLSIEIFEGFLQRKYFVEKLPTLI